MQVSVQQAARGCILQGLKHDYLNIEVPTAFVMVLKHNTNVDGDVTRREVNHMDPLEILAALYRHMTCVRTHENPNISEFVNCQVWQLERGFVT
jgi:rhamnogalacturonyl hydrolase YesR